MKELLRLKRVWLLALLPIAVLLTVIAVNSLAFAEGYALTVYSVLSKACNFITSLVPFSLAEWMVVIFFTSLLAFQILSVVKIIRSKGRRGFLAGKLGINLLCTVSVVFFLYTVTCGINYSRLTFAQVSGLDVRPSSADELEALCAELAFSVSELRPQVEGFPDSYATAQEAKRTFDQLEADYPTLKSGYGQPKPVLASRLMSWCDITGIFFPFTFEANVNVDIPAYNIPLTMCHELTHLRGYMREDEANFIAYLACRQSGNADFRYSGDMLAFVYANNALYSVDPERGNQVYSTLSQEVQQDFAENSLYWKQFEGPVAEVASAVNDTYLKSNRQTDGVKSYGRVVDLLLADYRQRHGLDK